MSIEKPEPNGIKELLANTIISIESQCENVLEKALSCIHSLEAEISEAKKGCFGFMFRSDETLAEGINRNYAGFDNERQRLNKLIEQQAEEIKRLKEKTID